MWNTIFYSNNAILAKFLNNYNKWQHRQNPMPSLSSSCWACVLISETLCHIITENGYIFGVFRQWPNHTLFPVSKARCTFLSTICRRCSTCISSARAHETISAKAMGARWMRRPHTDSVRITQTTITSLFSRNRRLCSKHEMRFWNVCYLSTFADSLSPTLLLIGSEIHQKHAWINSHFQSMLNDDRLNGWQTIGARIICQPPTQTLHRMRLNAL